MTGAKLAVHIKEVEWKLKKVIKIDANQLHTIMREKLDEYYKMHNKHPNTLIMPKEYKELIDVLFIKLSMYGALLDKINGDYVFCNVKIKFDDVDDIICGDWKWN